MNQHVVGSIISNLQTVFESIYNMSSAVPNGANTTPTDSLSVVVSGLYSSTVDRVYTIEVTTAGIQGVAQCTITDSLGTDSIVTPQTISNGVVINVGSLGAKAVFNMQGTDEFVLGDKWSITCKYEYYTNVKKVVQAQGAPQHLDMLPGIAFTFGGISYEDNGSSDVYHCDVQIPVELWLDDQVGQNIQTRLLYALSDIEHAVSIDPSRGGVAIDTFVLNSTPFLPVPGEPFAAVSVELGVRFKNYIR